MNVIWEKLREIRQKPQLYLAEPTVVFLKTFIDGYAMRECELNGDTMCKILDGFQTYAEQIYHEKLALSWASIISKRCKSEEEAFSVFFVLFEEYAEKFPFEE